MSREFAGTIAEAEADEAKELESAGAPTPEEREELEETPPPEETVPPAAAAKPAEPPPAAAAAPSSAKKWKIPRKVEDEEDEVEISEDDFDPAKSPERFEYIKDVFRKAKDYDRKGGALDKASAKKAKEIHTAYMLREGLWLRDEASGNIVENPQVAAYRKWRETGGAPAGAPAAPAPPASGAGGAPAAPAQETPRGKRIAELRAKYAKPQKDGGGLTLDEMDEWQTLRSEEVYDQREATKAETARKAHADAEARTSREQKLADAEATALAEIDKTVKSLEDKLKNPKTGTLNPMIVKAAKAHMREALIQSEGSPAERWETARKAAREFADSQAAEFQPFAKVPPKSTAAAPAPVARGSAGDTTGKKDEGEDDEHDYSKPFSKQKKGALARFEKTVNGVASG